MDHNVSALISTSPDMMERLLTTGEGEYDDTFHEPLLVCESPSANGRPRSTTLSSSPCHSLSNQGDDDDDGIDAYSTPLKRVDAFCMDEDENDRSGGVSPFLRGMNDSNGNLSLLPLPETPVTTGIGNAVVVPDELQLPESVESPKIVTKNLSMSRTLSTPLTLFEQKHQNRPTVQVIENCKGDHDERKVTTGQSKNFKFTKCKSTLVQNVATEHRILVTAVLAALAERDHFAIEAARWDDPRTIKSGPLKKASRAVRGVWKVKYAEVRRGLFTYYEDDAGAHSAGVVDFSNQSQTMSSSGHQHNSTPNTSTVTNTLAGNFFHNQIMLLGGMKQPAFRRRTLPLRANTCTCRAVRVKPSLVVGAGGLTSSQNTFIFELTVEGGPKRLWMTRSREERRAWINAIHSAMIGANGHTAATYCDGLPPGSPHRRDVESYMDYSRRLAEADSAETYVDELARLSGRCLRIPVQWLVERIDYLVNGNDVSGNDNSSVIGAADLNNHNNYSEHGSKGEKADMSQLWKDMSRDSVEINGVLYKGDEGHGLERMIGAIMRLLLESDSSNIDAELHQNELASSSLSDKNSSFPTPNTTQERKQKKRRKLMEHNAVSYARDILLAANRTRSAGDSYYCVDTLCANNSGLVVTCPYSSQAAPLQITISQSHSCNSDHLNAAIINVTNHKDLCRGWIFLRHGRIPPRTRWVRRFVVLSSGGVFSFYEKELPRPHGLRGQMVLGGLTVSQIADTSNFVVTLYDRLRMRDRQLRFDDPDDLKRWKEAFEKAIQNGSSFEERCETSSQSLDGNQSRPKGKGIRLRTLQKIEMQQNGQQEGILEKIEKMRLVRALERRFANGTSLMHNRMIKALPSSNYVSLENEITNVEKQESKNVDQESIKEHDGTGDNIVSSETNLQGIQKHENAYKKKKKAIAKAREKRFNMNKIARRKQYQTTGKILTPNAIEPSELSDSKHEEAHNIDALESDNQSLNDEKDNSNRESGTKLNGNSEQKLVPLSSGNKKSKKKASHRKRSVRSSKSSAVTVNVGASTLYKICTVDPVGVEEEDTWAVVQTTFLQTFRITGKKMVRGEEIVEIKLLGKNGDSHFRAAES